jgi:hypothetical protein
MTGMHLDAVRLKLVADLADDVGLGIGGGILGPPTLLADEGSDGDIGPLPCQRPGPALSGRR